jgi:hypothetical protein
MEMMNLTFKTTTTDPLRGKYIYRSMRRVDSITNLGHNLIDGTQKLKKEYSKVIMPPRRLGVHLTSHGKIPW